MAFGITYPMPPDPVLVPGSGATCASATDCKHFIYPSNPYQNEPFWQDQFDLLIHPQFAAWVLGSGESRYVLLGAVPVLAHTSVLDLAACADSKTMIINPCELDYSDAVLKTGPGGSVQYTGSTESLTLTPVEASNLLHLDPFYGVGQNAGLDPRRAVPISSAPYGARAGDLPRPYQANVTNLDLKTEGINAKTDYTASVVDVIGNATSEGSALTTLYISEAGSVTNGEKQTEQTDTTVSYTDSTATSQQLTTSATGVLNDLDNTDLGSGGPACKVCHNPLPKQPSANIFLDKKFGGFMYQDTSAPAAPSRGPLVNFVGMLVQELVRQEQAHQRFLDVKNRNPAKVAIGVLDRAGIDTPSCSRYVLCGNFYPNATITRSDFITWLVRALKLTPRAPERVFSDVPRNSAFSPYLGAAEQAGLLVRPNSAKFGPSDSVTREEMAALVARAFNLKKTTHRSFKDGKKIAAWAASGVRETVANGYLKVFPDGTFKPNLVTSRAQGAVVIFSALTKQQ